MKALFASLLVALAASTAPAQPAPVQAAAPAEAATPSSARLGLARRFIAVSAPTELMMEGVRTGFMHGASGQLADIEDDGERAEAEVRLEQLFVRLQPKFEGLIPGVLEAYAQVYAREFSEAELEAMIAFAETPAGKHYLARYAFLEMEPELIEAQQSLMSEIWPEVEEFGKQMCAEKAAKRLAAGDKKATCPLSRDEDTAAG